MPVAVIANPTSGRGKTAKLIPRVGSLLRSLGVDHAMHVSSGPEDAEAKARAAAADGATVVTALGGDGQVHAVANGVIGSGAALGIVPGGTGNDFARIVGLDRKDPLSAARLLAAPDTRVIDAVMVQTGEGRRRFVNVAGAGFDAEVNAHANGVRFLKGTPRYVFSVFVMLARFEAGDFTVSVDGETHHLPGMMIAVGNGVSYGGGMKICPTAVIDDGDLEVCVIGALSKFEFIKTFPKVFSGRHVEHPAVTVLHGREIEVSAPGREFQVYGDGERMGTLPATFTVEPGAFSVVVPPTASVS